MKYYVIFFVVIVVFIYVLMLVLGVDKVDLDKYLMVIIIKGDMFWELFNKYYNYYYLIINEFVKWVEDVNDLNLDIV